MRPTVAILLSFVVGVFLSAFFLFFVHLPEHRRADGTRSHPTPIVDQSFFSYRTSRLSKQDHSQRLVRVRLSDPAIKRAGPNFWSRGLPRQVEKSKVFELLAHQFGGRCKSHRLLVSPPWNFGFGSFIHALVSQIGLAWCVKRRHVMAGMYKSFDGVCDKSHTCVLGEIGSCSVTWEYFTKTYRLSTHVAFSDKRVVTYGQAVWGTDEEVDRDAMDKCEGDMSLYVAAQAPASKAKDLVNESLLGFVFRPHPDLIHYAEKTWRELNMHKTECIAVHIRRGDKIVWGEAKAVHLKDFVKAVYDMLPNYKENPIPVYIASDDRRLLQWTKFFPDVMFVVRDEVDEQTKEAFKDGYSQEKMWGGSRELKYSILRETIADLLLLSSCRYFVGQASSNISRFVMELQQSHFGNDAVWRSVD